MLALDVPEQYTAMWSVRLKLRDAVNVSLHLF